MPRVLRATPFVQGAMDSLGHATLMYIRQFQFPDSYRDNEKYKVADSDRCVQWDRAHVERCLDKYAVGSESGLGWWVERQKSDELVLLFLVELLKADPRVIWTGYRVLGSVRRGNGYPVWTLELFAKSPESNTKVYSSHIAPNVMRAGRDRIFDF